MAECEHCHYRTVLRDDPIDLPFAQSFAPFISAEEIVLTLERAKDVGSACYAVLQRGFKKASAAIEEHRDIAIAALLELMDRREQRLRDHFTDPRYAEQGLGSLGAALDNAICQTLYLLLLQHGLIVLPRSPVPAAHVIAIFGQRIFPFLSSLVATVKLLVPAIRERRMHFSWVEDTLRAEKLEKHDMVVESGINMLLQEQRDERDALQKGVVDAIASKSCRQALALATGVDIELLTQLLESQMQPLIDQGVGARDGERIAVASALLTPEFSVLFDKLTLDLSTLERFRAPCFFDTGPLRTKAASRTNLIAESPAINWTAYYPCYIAHSPQDGSRVYLTSPRAWQGMLMSIAQRPAYALDRAHETLARAVGADDKLSRVRTLIRQTHSEIEMHAGRVATEAGWQCRTGIETFGTTPLPVGEIDLIATAQVGDMSVILLAEAKNNDTPLAVPESDARVTKVVAQAGRQLRKKGSWISEHWEETLAFLKGARASPRYSRRVLVRVIITRRPLAAHYFDEFPGTSLAGFNSLARDLLRPNHKVWNSAWRVHVYDVSQA